MYVQRNIRRVHETIFAVEKQWVLYIPVCVRDWVCVHSRVYVWVRVGVCV
jgi:hypothetical protein